VKKEEDMRRTFVIGATLVAIAAGVLIGVASYHAGVAHGLDQAARSGRVIRVVGPEYGPGFGFGFLLFPLFIIGTILLVRGLFWRRHWAGHEWDHHGPGPMGRRQMFEDWHRRQHEEPSASSPGTGAGPGTPVGV
jgi:hypothetical protein